MKALEILDYFRSEQIAYGCTPFLLEMYNESIAELEALQQRSCEECVHRSFIDEALTNKVTNGFCIENGFFTKRDFCCNRYEAKEQ